jgi:hypothetical protein
MLTATCRDPKSGAGRACDQRHGPGREHAARARKRDGCVLNEKVNEKGVAYRLNTAAAPESAGESIRRREQAAIE